MMRYVSTVLITPSRVERSTVKNLVALNLATSEAILSSWRTSSLDLQSSCCRAKDLKKLLSSQLFGQGIDEVTVIFIKE
jgi:hypothetical protein